MKVDTFQGRKRKDAGSPQLCLHVARMLASQPCKGAEGRIVGPGPIYMRQ